jgi:riboflavin synthase
MPGAHVKTAQPHPLDQPRLTQVKEARDAWKRAQQQQAEEESRAQVLHEQSSQAHAIYLAATERVALYVKGTIEQDEACASVWEAQAKAGKAAIEARKAKDAAGEAAEKTAAGLQRLKDAIQGVKDAASAAKRLVQEAGHQHVKHRGAVRVAREHETKQKEALQAAQKAVQEAQAREAECCEGVDRAEKEAMIYQRALSSMAAANVEQEVHEYEAALQPKQVAMAGTGYVVEEVGEEQGMQLAAVAIAVPLPGGTPNPPGMQALPASAAAAALPAPATGTAPEGAGPLSVVPASAPDTSPPTPRPSIGGWPGCSGLETYLHPFGAFADLLHACLNVRTVQGPVVYTPFADFTNKHAHMLVV